MDKFKVIMDLVEEVEDKELESFPKQSRRGWSDEEIAFLLRYYDKVGSAKLAEVWERRFGHPRSRGAILTKAVRMQGERQIVQGALKSRKCVK